MNKKPDGVDRENREHCRRIRQFWEEINTLLMSTEEQEWIPLHDISEAVLQKFGGGRRKPITIELTPPLQALQWKIYELQKAKVATEELGMVVRQRIFEFRVRISMLQVLFEVLLAEELRKLEVNQKISKDAERYICRGWTMRFINP